MKNNNKDLYDKIDRFFNNEMTDSERLVFEKEINTDPGLAAEVSLHKDLQKTALLDDQHAQDFMAMNKQIHQSAQQEKAKQAPLQGNKNPNSGKSARRFNLRTIGMALAAAFALLVVYKYLIQPAASGHKQPPLAALYEANHPANDISFSNSKGASETSFEKLTENFKNKNYEKALALCKTYLQLENPEEYYVVLLTKGVCELELGQFDAALKTFTRYEKSSVKSAIKGTWFKALAYLRMEDVENCKKNLEIVVKDGRYKVNEAKTLLSQI